MDFDKKGYNLIVEDSQLEVRCDPNEPQGYIIRLKDKDRTIIFPRGTLEELANANRQIGIEIINNLASEFFFEDVDMTYDSIIAIATKAYLKEQENYQIWKIQKEFKTK